MSEPRGERPTPREFLAEIPSPSRRLWAGLCVILSAFVVFALYALHEIRWLEDFQVNVVEKNRKDSLQLLRLQNDAYLLAISLRDLTLGESKYPMADWRAAFDRLHSDMNDALRLEDRFAVTTPGTREMARDKRAQLRLSLADYWHSTDRAFALAARGREAEARRLIQTELESKRAVISEIAARLLALNYQTQVEAAETINLVYGRVKRDVLVLVGVLFLLALGTGLYVFEANRRTFERLHHLAEQLQSQSAQLQKLSWKLIDVQEETLRRVARDLHDEFGQILTAIGAVLSRAARKSEGQNSPEVAALVREVQSVQGIVQETLQKVRDQSQMFHPAILDDFGLEQALRWLARQFARQTGIHVSFEASMADGAVPPEAAVHLYRIVQEALSNVARHSGSPEARVRLKEEGGCLSLEIEDCGRGFEGPARSRRDSPEGLGLMGMRERAEHLNGTLAIRSAPGAGTTVSVRIPRRELKPSVEKAS